MTIQEIKTLLVSVDPGVQRYEHDHTGGESYTVWHDYGDLDLYGDGREEGSIRFQVDRFTKDEDDAIAQALKTTLRAQDDITVIYRSDYEKDTGYIHHIYDCEGI